MQWRTWRFEAQDGVGCPIFGYTPTSDWSGSRKWGIIVMISSSYEPIHFGAPVFFRDQKRCVPQQGPVTGSTRICPWKTDGLWRSEKTGRTGRTGRSWKELEGKRAKLWLCDLNKCWVNKAEHEISCWLGHEWLGDKSSAQKRPVSWMPGKWML